MHDELFERRLRTVLRAEGDELSFTITPAELERRLALRGRNAGGRRLELLLAAAVGIGALGVGSLLAGYMNPTPNQSPEPSAPLTVATEPPPATLPSLDELIAAGEAEPGEVLLAQAYGPADGPVTQPGVAPVAAPNVTFDVPPGIGDYTVTLACLGDDVATNALVQLSGRIPVGNTPTRCDGTVDETISSNGPRELSLRLTGPASWRVVVRRTSAPVPGPTAGPQPAVLSYDERIEEALVDIVDETSDSETAVLGNPEWPVREVGSVPGRERYVVRASCGGGGSIRYILGDEIDGELIVNTETQLRCETDHDGQSDAHEAILEIPQPNGSRVFVAADPATRFSLLVTSEPPPVDLVREEPGWQLSAGFGPDLAFEANGHAFTGPGVEGGGPVMIAVACAGTGSIEVLVTLQHSPDGPVTETTHAEFDAQCEPGGATTSQSFADADDYVDVEFAAPAGTWTALSILVPDPLPTPD